jgi:nucleoprotein TPR
MAATVDVGYLAASYSVPETSLQSLLSEPTVELVQSLLTQIETKARAYDDLQSEKIRTDVELEAAVQGGEQRARALKAAAEKAQKEAEELKNKLAQEGKTRDIMIGPVHANAIAENARQQAETELHNLQSTASSSTSETQALESRIKTLESHNRDAIAMHEAKTAAHDRLAKELSEQHQKSVELRKQVSTLEEKIQSLESAATNVKFRETNLQQEIEQLRTNNDWYTTELKTRADDHSKYRKEKNAQIAQLQRENADASETIDALRRTETLLRQHVEELKTNAEQDRVRIEELENAASKAEADYRINVDGAKRLATLHQQNGEITKKRLEELQADSARMQEDAAAEIGHLQAEVELERSKVAEIEARTAELETLVENLKSDNSDLRSSVRVPATPRHGMNGGSFSTPGRAGTPVRAGSPAVVFSPGGSQLKADATKTQLLIENNDLKKELRRVREKHEEQTSVVNDMLQELESRQPEFDELRRQNDALTEQSNDISNLLDEAIAARETAQRESRKAMGDLEGVQNECALLHKQIQDMTIQLRSLLWRREAEENGLGSLPADQQKLILETVEKNEVPDEFIPEDTLTHTMITKHLVLYKNVADLQQQNSELLRTIRQVGDEHEKQESRMNSEQYAKDVEELGQLRSTVAEKDEQIKTLNLRAQTLKTERDMYSRIVGGRGQPPSHSQSTSAFAQSVPAGGAPLQFASSTQSQEIPEYSKLIKDLQSHIDLLKEESATDRATSKSHIDGLTKDNAQLQSDKIRLESQVRREQDRYARLEGSIKLLQSEKDSLQERYNNVQKTLAQQDDRLVKATQNAAEAETRLESMKGEMTHLKAAQQMATTIEARLKERNQELMTERDRLSNMVSSVQSLRNEAELATAESRRELQNTVDQLRADLHNTERKLEDEIAEHKKATQQRDYERTEAQRRIDDLIAARNSAEVKTATADSTRQQLEQRVKDLQGQLQSAEERVQALQPRLASHTNGSGNDEEELANREDELNAQVEDLQRKLARKQEDLEAVTAQIAGFQEIAQDAEERLQNFVEAHERLQEQLNLAEQEKDATINDLQQRVEEISSELATSSTELTEIRGQHEQDSLVLRQEKETLEAEITRLNNEVADYRTEAEQQTQLVNAQAEIAERAQKEYEHEFEKHHEAMRNLRELREQHNQVQTEIAQFKAQAEAARTTLEQSQEHWKSTEGRYESQMADAKRRHDDLKQYNETLLKQFDEYKEQINSLKSERSTVAAGDAGSSAPGSSNLQDIETYLRREKEILEVQLNLKVQESKRLEQQLTHAQTQLDQTREKLLEEQSKASGSSSNSTLQQLNEKINELNVYRESNATLRSENTHLQSQFAEKAKELENLQSQFEPLQVRVSELEGELELNVGHLKAVEEDRDRWQKRHQDVLQRYDRIDPKELEDLRKQIEDHKGERDQALEQVTGLNEQITALTTDLEKAAEVKTTEVKAARDKFNTQHNARMKEKNATIREITGERDQALETITNLQQELESVRQQLTTSQTTQTDATQNQGRIQSLQQELEQARAQLATAQQNLEAANAARDEALSQAKTSAQATTSADSGEDGQINENDSGDATQRLSELQKQLEEAQQKAKQAESNQFSAQGRLSSLEVQLSLQKQEMEKLEAADVSHPQVTSNKQTLIVSQAEKSTKLVELRQELSQAKAGNVQPASDAATAETTANSVSTEEIEKLKQDLAARQKEIEELQTALENANSAAGSANADATDKPNTTSAELDERESQLKVREEEIDQRDKIITNREQKEHQLRKNLSAKLTAAKEKYDQQVQELDAKHQAELERLQQEKQAADASRNAAPTQEPPKETTEAFTGPVPEGMILTEDLPRPMVPDTGLASWLKNNAGALRVVKAQIHKNLANHTAKKEEAIAKLHQEIEQLKAQKPAETVKEEPEQDKSANMEAEIAKLMAENEEKLVKKEASVANMYNTKLKLKDNQLAVIRVRFSYFEKVAKETPTEEVGKVYAVAITMKPEPKPAAQPSTPAKQAPTQSDATPQAPNAATPAQPNETPASAQQQQSAANTPQGNDGNATSFNQSSQQPNPFAQAGHGTAVNPFLPTNLGGGRGLPQPGFTVQGQAQQQQQQPQQQQQQLGRGRGEGVGTGLQAIRGALQSNIPRGGVSSIPLPGGRGRGQQQQGQAPNQVQGAGASQIGRGGGRGAGRGRGGFQQQGHNQNLNQSQQGQNQGSPARGLNPGAQGFQPGASQGGRGQKRGAEDEGEGAANRGGKRARGQGRGAGAE